MEPRTDRRSPADGVPGQTKLAPVPRDHLPALCRGARDGLNRRLTKRLRTGRPLRKRQRDHKRLTVTEQRSRRPALPAVAQRSRSISGSVTGRRSPTEQGLACVSSRLGRTPRASPEVSGWHQLTSDICREYARKFYRFRRFRWSQPCRPRTVNPSRELRRFESFTCHRVRERASDQRKRRSGAFLPYPVGVSKLPSFWQSSGSNVTGL